MFSDEGLGLFEAGALGGEGVLEGHELGVALPPAAAEAGGRTAPRGAVSTSEAVEVAELAAL